MDEVSILVRYGGEWEKCDLNYVYKGGKSKGIIVSSEISYTQLLNKIYDITKLHRLTHNIEMKYMYNVRGPTEPVEVEGDDDVRFFIRCNVDRSLPATSLCISSSSRAAVDNIGENVSLHDGGDDNAMNPIRADTDFEDADHPAFGCSRNMDNEAGIDHFYDDDGHTNNLFDDDHCNMGRDAYPSFPNDFDNDEPFNVARETSPNFPTNVAGPTNEAAPSIGPDQTNSSFPSVSGPSLSSNPYVFSEEGSAALKVGEIFMEKKELYKKLSMYALDMHF